MSADAVPIESPEAAHWKVVVGSSAAVFLGGVFLLGLYTKVLDPEGFGEVIEREGLAFLLPVGGVVAIGLAIEALLGLALIMNIRTLWVLIPTAVVVAFFLILTGTTYYLDAHGIQTAEASCGCFGHLIERSPAEAFWQDLLLMVPPLLLSFLGRPRGEALPLPRIRLAVTGAVTVLVLVFAWMAPGLALDDLATRLSPGVRAADLCAGEGEGEDGRICLDAVIPELAEGHHVVLMANLDDEAFLAQLPALNEYANAMMGPTLWVLTPMSEEQADTFRFEQQPSFELLSAPTAVLRPLYRRLPRSFRVRDGAVTNTWQRWPPLTDLAAEGDLLEQAPMDDEPAEEPTDDE